MALGIAATLQTDIRIGGEVLGGIQSFDEATGQITKLTGASAIAAGKTGSLTTRGGADTGELTMDSGHGLATSMIIDVSWDGGARYGMLIVVDGDAVAIDGGAGDDLPEQDTDVVASEQRVIVREVDAADIALIAVRMSQAGHLEAREADGAANAGTLTTRTDANSGLATLSGGHGITTGMLVNVIWATGARYGMEATVDVNAVTLEAGLGDDLPDEATALVVCERGATIAGVSIEAEIPWQWNEQSGLANPLAGHIVGELRIGNRAEVANEVLVALLVNDIQ